MTGTVVPSVLACVLSNHRLIITDDDMTAAPAKLDKDARGRPRFKKWHRMSKTPTYKSWLKMRERCTNPKAGQWKWYGGRGVNVCDRWLNSFEAFLEDMGPRPSRAHTIDRFPNTDGNYEPGNCRWAVHQEQVNNQRKTIWIELNGARVTLRQACRDAGIPFLRAYHRYRAGRDVADILKAGRIK